MNNKNTKNEKSAPKVSAKTISYEGLDKIGEIPVYYGFMPTKNPSISKADLEAAKGIMEGDYVDDETENHGKLPLHVEEKIALVRMYDEQGMYSLPQPVMMYFKDPCKGSIRKSGNGRYADLEVLGPSGSIAEAILIQTCRSMLSEEGYANTSVEINSIGDKESINRFLKELTNYYRKHINEMSHECRDLFKKDPFELLASHRDDCKELNERAPRAMDFLSEASRHHLEEVLEYMETLGIPYTMNNSLLGNRKYCTETIFTIVDSSEDKKGKQTVLAVGVRYNGLAKRLGMKKDIQGVGMSIIIKGKHADLRKPLTKMKKPIASFIQLGVESKLMALEVVEKLRHAKIPLYFSLPKDRLIAQVSSIEKYHTPYVIVIGKKEAMERTAIVRQNDTHSQEVVPIEDLARYMKAIEAKYNKV